MLFVIAWKMHTLFKKIMQQKLIILYTKYQNVKNYAKNIEKNFLQFIFGSYFLRLRKKQFVCLRKLKF